MSAVALKMVRTVAVGAAAAIVLLQSVPAAAQPAPPRQERVTFAKGASSATIKGQVKGDADVDYLVRAAAGQTITVSLKVSNRSNYFNVLPPGSADAAMYVGQTGEAYTGMLPTDGDYKVRVYLMRNAARRNEVSDFTLTITVTGKALAPTPASKDALIPGTPFHASTSIACLPMPYGDTKPQRCEAFVLRRGEGGTATVEIPSKGVTRRILFVQGKPVASDASEKMTVTRKGEVTTVKFESGEFYEIPDLLIFGG
jgi:hypothetical protein